MAFPNSERVEALPMIPFQVDNINFTLPIKVKYINTLSILNVVLGVNIISYKY